MNNTMSFFNALFGGYGELGFIELRSLSPRPDGGKNSYSVFCDSLPDLRSCEPFLQSCTESGKDLYFGVLPRSCQDSHKTAVTQARVLWVDIDAKERSKEECIRGLYTGRVPSPSLLVDSGGGIHAYWVLEDGTAQIHDVEDTCYGLAKALGGDCCHNADRILRVPGTFNFKNPEAPRYVSVIRSPNFQYPLSAFERYRLTGGDYRLGSTRLDELCPEPVALEELYDSLPDFLVEYIQHGLAADIYDTFKGDRSRLDFYIIGKLLRNGFNVHQVAGIFTDEQYAISGKTLSRRGKSREKYLGNSINRVKAVIEAERVEELV